MRMYGIEILLIFGNIELDRWTIELLLNFVSNPRKIFPFGEKNFFS